MKSAFISTSVIALMAAMAAPSLVAAQTASSDIVVTGVRQSGGVKAANSAAPVEVVGSDALKRVGQPDLIQSLSQTLPSFNAQGYGADTAALTLSAALRGLNPNETLILVDGKRRHTTANLAVDAGYAYTGSATTDLSFIPVGAIDHVEVLQDGAAAQYGTDAIAGVVNIILKKADHGGAFSATGGQYFAGDGDTGEWSLNKGFQVTDNGFLNVTLEQRFHGYSQRGSVDARYFDTNGKFDPSIEGLPPENVAGIPGAPGAPDDDHVFGDPTYQIYSLFYNAGYDLGSGLSLYSFGSYSHRNADSFENYRRPSVVEGLDSNGNLIVPFKNGFDPSEATVEDDYSFTGGIKGTLVGWDWDLSSTYGKDHDLVYTRNSGNAGLFPILQALSSTPVPAQSDFYDGSFDTTQWTSTFDVNHSFAIGLASPLNVAAGVEGRSETYTIGAGEPASYIEGGSSSFPGYAPPNAGAHHRDNVSGYIDLAVDPIAGLHLDLAGRTEHYSDFGDTTVGKLTGRYDFNPMIAVRGTVSTGFRAPTLAEEFYSGVNVAPTFGFGQLPPNSKAALAAGFGPLKPETSTNYSIGFVAHPISHLQITADAYEIDIKKRIVNSGVLSGTTAVANALTASGADLPPSVTYVGIQLFTNAADTKTQGVEVTATYASDFGDMGHIDWSLGFNYNETTITKQYALPASEYVPGVQTAILTPNAISGLTTEAPKEKLVLGAFWSLDKWSVNLRETTYGETSEWVSPNATGAGTDAADLKIGVTPIFDVDLGYKLTSAIKLDLGANNLFDVSPPTVPLVPGGGGAADGNAVYKEPDQFSPFGIDGGYYYGRVTYTF